jgi:hypothetical protein
VERSYTYKLYFFYKILGCCAIDFAISSLAQTTLLWIGEVAPQEKVVSRNLIFIPRLLVAPQPKVRPTLLFYSLLGSFFVKQKKRARISYPFFL